MKKLLFAILFVLIASPAISRWCYWNGTSGESCQTDNKGYLKVDSVGISGGEINYNSHGFYELTITQPTLADDETKDAEVWSKDGNQLSLTWSVRDMTQDELDEIDADEGLISREMYYVLKWLIDEGVISAANISNAPAKLKAAYQARGRLEAE